MSETLFQRLVRALTIPKKDRCPEAAKATRLSLSESSRRLDEVLKKLEALELAHVKVKR
jgi:hypothetical protein